MYDHALGTSALQRCGRIGRMDINCCNYIGADERYRPRWRHQHSIYSTNQRGYGVDIGSNLGFAEFRYANVYHQRRARSNCCGCRVAGEYDSRARRDSAVYRNRQRYI